MLKDDKVLWVLLEQQEPLDHRERLVHRVPRVVKAFRVRQALRGFKELKVLQAQQALRGFKAHRERLVLLVFKDRLVLLDSRGLQDQPVQQAQPAPLVLPVLRAHKVLRVLPGFKEGRAHKVQPGVRGLLAQQA